MASIYSWPLRLAPDLNVFCSYPNPFFGSQQHVAANLMRPQFPDSEKAMPSFFLPITPISTQVHIRAGARPLIFCQSAPHHRINTPFLTPGSFEFAVSHLVHPTSDTPVSSLLKRPFCFPPPISGGVITASASSAFVPASNVIQFLSSNSCDSCHKAVPSSTKKISVVKNSDPTHKTAKRLSKVNPTCIHNKRKTLCLICCGGSICEHKIQRHWCRLCGGGARCCHGKQKSRCRVCGGGSFCEHDRLRFRCKICKSVQRAE